MSFHIYKDAYGEWRWRLRAVNNKILADSGEGYTRRSDCIDAIKLIKAGIASAFAFDLTQNPVAQVPL